MPRVKDAGSLNVLVKRGKMAPIGSRYNTPGPGAYIHYTLTGYKGHDASKFREPCYTARPITMLINYETPGPGPLVYQDPRFDHRGLYNTPAYSMRCKCAPRPGFSNPAPNTYYTECIPPPQEKIAPAYTHAERTRYPLRFLTPAPNRYHLPEVMGRGQAYYPDDPGWTMPGKDDLFSFLRDVYNTPGPAAHKVVHPNVTRNRSPVYTMRPQTRQLQPFRTPAPNAYYAEHVTVHKPTIVKKTFGQKHSQYAGAMFNRVTSQCRLVPKLRKGIQRVC